MSHYVAVLETALERYDEADEHFTAALAFHTDLSLPIHTAYTQLEWGRMLLQRAAPGDVERGRQLIETARTAAAPIGAELIVNDAALLLTAT